MIGWWRRLPRPDKTMVARPGDVLVITFERRVTAAEADRIRLYAKSAGLDALLLDRVDQVALVRGGFKNYLTDMPRPGHAAAGGRTDGRHAWPGQPGYAPMGNVTAEFYGKDRTKIGEQHLGIVDAVDDAQLDKPPGTHYYRIRVEAPPPEVDESLITTIEKGQPRDG